jgi:hypothetical protein
VLFFNAKNENPADITAQLLARLKFMRSGYARSIRDLINAADQLFQNREEQHALAAQADVNQRLRVFLGQNRNLGPSKRAAFDTVLNAIRTLHPSTVWASTRRLGAWPGLDVHFYLGTGAEIDAKLRSDRPLNGLEELINNMLGDDGLTPTHRFLQQIMSSLENWKEEFFEAVRGAGENAYRPALAESADLWTECEGLYGQGLAYRLEVASRVQTWFEQDKNDAVHRQLERRISDAWKTHILEPLSKVAAEAVSN